MCSGRGLPSSLRQTGEQIQWIDVFGWVKLGADQVQVAPGGADVTMTEQFLDGEEVYAAHLYTHVLKVAAGGTASPLDALSVLVQ